MGLAATSAADRFAVERARERESEKRARQRFYDSRAAINEGRISRSSQTGPRNSRVSRSRDFSKRSRIYRRPVVSVHHSQSRPIKRIYILILCSSGCSLRRSQMDLASVFSAQQKRLFLCFYADDFFMVAGDASCKLRFRRQASATSRAACVARSPGDLREPT